MTSLDRRQFNRSLLAVPAAALVGTGLGALAPAAASAAPADWNAHLLTGQANDALMHQRRAGDGTWKASWTKVATGGSAIGRVSSAGISKDLHVVGMLNEVPVHSLRNGTDGSWRTFTEIPSQSGPTIVIAHAATSIDGQLHVFAGSDGGDLYHTVRNEDGSWQNSWKLLRTFEYISHLAATRVGSTLHIAVVANFGNILHSIRASDGSWSNWANVEGRAGDIGDVEEVALAGTGSQLQVVAAADSYQLFHAIRKGDGSWQQFKRMTAFADYRSFAIEAANVGGEMQFACIDLTTTGRTIRHTIRRTDGSWTPVRAVPATGLTDDPVSLSLAGTLKP